jgi:hypothetical protein
MVETCGGKVCRDCYQENHPEYRKYLVDWYNSQLVSHGAMLFAALVGSISYLAHVDNPAMTLLGTRGLAEWVILGCLLGFTTYVLSRIVWYGVLLTAANEYFPRLGQLLSDYGSPNPKVSSHDPLWEYSQLVIMQARCRCGDARQKAREDHSTDLTWEICKKWELNNGVKCRIYWLLVQPTSALYRIGIHIAIGLILSWGLMATLL